MSNYNPYAAPQVEALPPPPPVGVAGEPRPWTIGEVLSLGWARIKDDGGALVVSSFVVQGIAGIPANIPTVLRLVGVLNEGDTIYWIVFGVCTLVSLLAGAWFRGGLIKVWLDSARGRKIDVGDVFKGGRFFAPIFGAEMIWYLTSLVGFAFLIVPGIYVSLGFGMATTIIVDRQLGVMESLRESWRVMNGQRMGVLGYYFATMGLALGGLAACCVGIMVVVPWVGVAFTAIYLRATGQDDAVTTAVGP
jgi:hypothetical protein